jgi:hypothetical protein
VGASPPTPLLGLQTHPPSRPPRAAAQVGNPDGLALHELVTPLGGAANVSREAIGRLADALNARAIEGLEEPGDKPTHVAVTRNLLRKPINLRLALLVARRLGVRPIFWRSEDSLISFTTAAGGKAQHNWVQKQMSLSPQMRKAIANLPASACGGLGSVNLFFPGIEYIAADSIAPHAGRSKNNRCIGRKLVPDPKEPPFDPTSAVIWLKHTPSAIIVEPEDSRIGDVCRDLYSEVPAGCIPVRATTNRQNTCVALPSAMEIPGTKLEATTITFKRTGIPLDDGYCVTDYYCQGVSFGDESWVIHVAQPPGRHGLSRTSLYVMTTRYSELSRVRVLAPLWETPAGREAYIDALHASARPDPELAAEFRRLEGLWEATLRANQALARECGVPLPWEASTAAP